MQAERHAQETGHRRHPACIQPNTESAAPVTRTDCRILDTDQTAIRSTTKNPMFFNNLIIGTTLA